MPPVFPGFSFPLKNLGYGDPLMQQHILKEAELTVQQGLQMLKQKNPLDFIELTFTKEGAQPFKIVSDKNMDPNSIKAIDEYGKVVGAIKNFKQTKHVDKTPTYIMGSDEPKYFSGGPGYTVTEAEMIMEKTYTYESINVGAYVYITHEGLVTAQNADLLQYPVGVATNPSPSGDTSVVVMLNQVN